MKKIIAFILTVSILVQTIVSTNIFALQDFNDNSEDEISQSETYTDGSGFREYSVTYENITDHEIMLYLGISENGYDTAMQVLSSLQEKGYTREEQIELLGIVVQGFFSIEEAESIYGYIPEKDSRDKALKQFERFASLFNISEEINDSRLIEEAFTTHNTFDTDRQIVSSEYYLEFLPETYTVSVTESINELDDTKTDTVLCFSDTAKQRHLELTSFSSYLKAKELFLNGMSIDSIKSLFCLAAFQNKHIEEVIPSGSNSLSINPETTYTAMSATLSNSTDYEDAINAGELIMTLTEEEEANDSIYSPFKIDIGSNENINIQYGTVSYEQDIFSLPGRNGMDISLKIKYDSSQADLGVDYKGYVDFDTSNDPFGIGTGWYIEVPHFYRKGEVVYIPGRGKFNFAQIVPDKSNRMPGGKPKGYLGGDVIIESWYFDPGNNIEIPLEQPDILNGKADNALHTADGKSYYFDGFRALCETDRFGNMILYEYDEIEFLGKEVLTSIVDTNGNRISFEYSDLGENQYLLTITAPDESEFKIYFSRHAADKTETYTRVDKICNQENEITEFYYQFYQLKCNFFPYLPEVESDTNYCNLLKTVTYPTGLKSEYTYKMLYDYAATDRSLTNEKYVLQSSAFTETDGENVTEYGGLDFEYYGFEQTDPDYDDKEYGDYAKVTENNGVTHEYDFVGVYRSTEKKYDSDGNLAETIETRFEGPEH